MFLASGYQAEGGQDVIPHSNFNTPERVSSPVIHTHPRSKPGRVTRDKRDFKRHGPKTRQSHSVTAQSPGTLDCVMVNSLDTRLKIEQLHIKYPRRLKT